MSSGRGLCGAKYKQTGQDRSVPYLGFGIENENDLQGVLFTKFDAAVEERHR